LSAQTLHPMEASFDQRVQRNSFTSSSRVIEMGKLITQKDLKEREQSVNALLNMVKLKVARRCGNTAIDICHPKGRAKDTLLAGLTKRQAYDVLYAIKMVLVHEKL